MKDNTSEFTKSLQTLRRLITEMEAKALNLDMEEKAAYDQLLIDFEVKLKTALEQVPPAARPELEKHFREQLTPEKKAELKESIHQGYVSLRASYEKSIRDGRENLAKMDKFRINGFDDFFQMSANVLWIE